MKRLILLLCILIAANSVFAQNSETRDKDIASLDSLIQKKREVETYFAKKAQENGGRIPDSLKQACKAEIASVSAMQNKALHDFVVKYPGTYQGAKYLWKLVEETVNEMNNREIEAAEVAEIDRLEALYADSKYIDPVKHYVRVLHNRVSGASIPYIPLQTTDGKTVNLKDFIGHGNLVYVFFTASWCGPCHMQLPHLREVYEKFHPQGFEILSVSIDAKKEAWLKDVEQNKLSWPQLIEIPDEDINANTATNAFIMRSIPVGILYDQQGKVIHSQLFGSPLEEAIEKALAE